MDSKVAQAYRLAKAGEKIKAQNLLISVVRSDEKNEDAWLLLGLIIEPKQKKLRCLRKVVEINPENKKAQKALSRLKGNNLTSAESPQISSSTSIIHRKSNKPETATQKIPLENPLPQTLPLTDQQLVEQYISEMSSEGWTVVSLTKSSVQLRKPKQWNATLLILGTIGIVFMGIGLLLIFLAVIDYLLKKDETKFITTNEIRYIFDLEQRKDTSRSSQNNKSSLLNDPLILILLIIFLVAIFTILVG